MRDFTMPRLLERSLTDYRSLDLSREEICVPHVPGRHTPGPATLCLHFVRNFTDHRIDRRPEIRHRISSEGYTVSRAAPASGETHSREMHVLHSGVNSAGACSASIYRFAPGPLARSGEIRSGSQPSTLLLDSCQEASCNIQSSSFMEWATLLPDTLTLNQTQTSTLRRGDQ